MSCLTTKLLREVGLLRRLRGTTAGNVAMVLSLERALLMPGNTPVSPGTNAVPPMPRYSHLNMRQFTPPGRCRSSYRRIVHMHGSPGAHTGCASLGGARSALLLPCHRS